MRPLKGQKKRPRSYSQNAWSSALGRLLSVQQPGETPAPNLMTRGVLTLGVMFLLLPAPAGAQNGIRLFVEGGPAADYNSPPFSISGIGVTVGGGILPTPTVSVGFNAERVKLRFNEASWWSYAVTIGKTVSLTRRVGVGGSVGIGRVKSREHGLERSAPAVTLELSLPIRMTSQLSIGPQWRHRLEFEREGGGLVTVIGVSVRWQQRP